MTSAAEAPTHSTINDLPWPEFALPSTDLPSDDGDNSMGSSWHADVGSLMKYRVIARHGGDRTRGRATAPTPAH